MNYRPCINRLHREFQGGACCGQTTLPGADYCKDHITDAVCCVVADCTRALVPLSPPEDPKLCRTHSTLFLASILSLESWIVDAKPFLADEQLPVIPTD